MRSAEQIMVLYRDRKAKYALLHSKMQEIADIYNGRSEVPLLDMERNEKPSVPNLLAAGVDQMAGRITSVTPAVTFSSARPGIRKHDRVAADASRAVTGWWQSDHLSMKMKQRGRRLIAYGMAPVVMRWNFEDHRPVWQVRHPLETFPALDLEPGRCQPQDVIFAYKRTIGWLADNGYADKAWVLTGGEDVTRDTVVTCIEYIDADHTVLMAVGFYGDSYTGYTANGLSYPQYTDDATSMKGVVLEAYENLSEEIPVVIPTRLTLDQMAGQFDNMIGMYYAQAKLMALEYIAVEKGVFPDTYLVSRPSEVGRFLDGPHDGRTGKVNIVAGGDIKEIQSQPGYMSTQTIDRLERAQRVTAGIPPEFGGESGSNIRTGRRGDAVLSAVIDYPVAEAQEAFAFALEEENEIAMSMAKRIDGNTARTIYVGTGNARRPVTYKPTETFEVEEHVVTYPATGSDLNSLIIGIGQRVGLGIMSKETAATLDPYIDNPEIEHDQIISEGLEQALLAGLQQQASSGTIPPLALAKIMTMVKNDKMELAEAMHKVTEEAMKEQEQSAGGPPEDPAAAAAPGTVEALAGVQKPNQGQQNLADLLSTLRKPALAMRG